MQIFTSTPKVQFEGSLDESVEIKDIYFGGNIFKVR